MAPPSEWYSDTDPKARVVFIELQRKMTPGLHAEVGSSFARPRPAGALI